jgi:hypothetical protein
VLAGISVSEEAIATTEVNDLNARRASYHFLTIDSSLVSRRVRLGDRVIEATASIQIAVLEELRAPDR